MQYIHGYTYIHSASLRSNFRLLSNHTPNTLGCCHFQNSSSLISHKLRILSWAERDRIDSVRSLLTVLGLFSQHWVSFDSIMSLLTVLTFSKSSSLISHKLRIQRLRDAGGGAGVAEVECGGRGEEEGSSWRREAGGGSGGWEEGEGRRGGARPSMVEALEWREDQAGMDDECISWLLSLVCYDRCVSLYVSSHVSPYVSLHVSPYVSLYVAGCIYC